MKRCITADVICQSIMTNNQEWSKAFMSYWKLLHNGRWSCVNTVIHQSRSNIFCLQCWGTCDESPGFTVGLPHSNDVMPAFPTSSDDVTSDGVETLLWQLESTEQHDVTVGTGLHKQQNDCATNLPLLQILKKIAKLQGRWVYHGHKPDIHGQ